MNNKLLFIFGFITASILFSIGFSFATITSGGGQTTLSYTVSNAQAVEVANAFAWAYGYQDTLCNNAIPQVCTPNPQTKGEFTDMKIKQYVKDVVIAYRRSQIDTTVNTTVTVN